MGGTRRAGQGLVRGKAVEGERRRRGSGRISQDQHRPLPALDTPTMLDIQELDEWVTHLSDCKQLAEADVKRLCDKVNGALSLLRVARPN
jgi:hypothetical protein